MASCTIRSEFSRDVDGIELNVITKQGFEEISPSNDARAYRIVHEGGTYTLTEEIQGSTGSGSYQVESSVASEPIENNKFFLPGGGAAVSDAEANLWKIWKKNPQDPQLATGVIDNWKGAFWSPLDDGDMPIQTLLYLYNREQTTFLSPRVVIKKIIVEDTAPDLSKVGVINWPGLSGVTPEGMNFILAGAHGQQMGDQLWQNTYEWMGSGRNGWDQNLYADSSGGN
jgi:hypothetical protein